MWKFNRQQIDEFIQYRQSQLPQGYTVQDEMKMINYYCCVFLPTLYRNNTNQYTLVSYAAVLFKRFYMNKTIFQQQTPHQILLTTNYLGLKLYGYTHNAIQKFASEIKNKPKHVKFVHFGHESYAKYEMEIVQSLGYDIDLKPIYSIILSINYMLNIRELFDQTHYPNYDRRIREYFLKALQEFTIFLYSDSEIAFAIVECALQIASQEVLIPNTQLNKLKRLYNEKQTSGKMFIVQLEIKELDMRKYYDSISEIVQSLLELKDNLKEHDKDFEKFKQIKQRQFEQPTNVEFTEIKKQIQQI